MERGLTSSFFFGPRPKNTDQGDAYAARTSREPSSAGANARIDNARHARVHAQGHASVHSTTAPARDRSNAQEGADAGAGTHSAHATHFARQTMAYNPLPPPPRDRWRENAQAGPSAPPVVRPNVYANPMWSHEPAHRVATPPQSILVGGSATRRRRSDTTHRDPYSGASSGDEGYRSTATASTRARARPHRAHAHERPQSPGTPHPRSRSRLPSPEEQWSEQGQERELQHNACEQTSEVILGYCSECLLSQCHDITCPLLQADLMHFIPQLHSSSEESSAEAGHRGTGSEHSSPRRDTEYRAANYRAPWAEDEPDDPSRRATPALSSRPSTWTTSPRHPPVQQRLPSPESPRRRTSSRVNAAPTSVAAPPPAATSVQPPPPRHASPVIQVHEPEPRSRRVFGGHQPVIPEGVSLRDDDESLPSPPPSPPRPPQSSTGSMRILRARPIWPPTAGSNAHQYGQTQQHGQTQQYPQTQQYQQWNTPGHSTSQHHPQQSSVYFPPGFFNPPSAENVPPPPLPLPPLPNPYPTAPPLPQWAAYNQQGFLPAPYPNVPFYTLSGNVFQDARYWPLPDNRIAAAAALRMGNTLPYPVTPLKGYLPPIQNSPDRTLPLSTPVVTSDPGGHLLLSEAYAYVPARGVGQQPSTAGSAMVLISASSLSVSPFQGPQLHHALIPNPERPDVPSLKWDVRTPPQLAQHITSSERILPFAGKFQDALTDPEVAEVQITYYVSGIFNFFGPLHIRQSRTVTVGDALRAIYEFFQTPLRQDQVALIEGSHPAVWRTWVDAFRRRCTQAPHIAIPEVEWQQGMRRVDCLGERVKYWGSWCTHNYNRSWQINLGLVAATELAPHCQSW